jgi:hypothetical protein
LRATFSNQRKTQNQNEQAETKTGDQNSLHHEIFHYHKLEE